MKILRVVAIVVAVIVVILIALPFFINVNSFKPKIESEMSAALGRKSEVGNLSLSIITGSVSVDNISIADDLAFSKSPFLTARSLKVGVELLPLIFSKELHVTGVTLHEPSITLLSNAKGVWNFSTIGTSAPKASQKPAEVVPAAAKSEGGGLGGFSVAKVNVNNGKLVIGKVNSSEKPITIDKVNLEVRDFSATSQFPFKLSAALPSGGDLNLDGKAGPLSGEGTPVSAALKIAKADLAAIGADPSVGLAGLANLDGTLDSNGKTAKVNGTVTADKLKMSPKGSPAPRPVEVKFATNYDLKRQGGDLSQGDVSYGKAVVHLTGRYQMEGAATVVNMKLDGQAMPVDDLESLLPSLGVILPSGSSLKGGTLSTTLAISGPTDKLVITGPIKVENTALTGFDMGGKLGALAAFGGKTASSKDTVIQNCSTDVRVAPEGTKADNINLTVPSIGVVTGSGTVSPAGALDFHMLADLKGGLGGALTEVATLGGGGKKGGGIPFMIEGTTSDPKFVPDVKGLAEGAVQQAIGGKLGKQAQNPAGALQGLFKKKP
jgi:AsmA protein